MACATASGSSSGITVAPQFASERAGEPAEAPELPDHHAAVGHRVETGSETLTLANGADSGPGTRLPAHPHDAADGLWPAHAVGGDAAVRLEVGQGLRGARTEDAVDAPAIEAQARQTRLEVGDIVTTQIGRGEEQLPVAGLP